MDNGALQKLLGEARRNEEILRRLEAIEDFLVGHQSLARLFQGMGRKIGEVYGLQAVTVCINRDNPGLMEALSAEGVDLPADCHLKTFREMQGFLGALDRPYLCSDITRKLRRCFFPHHRGLASMAVIPIRGTGQLLCTLNMGSDDPHRYQPGYETDFLSRLGRKVALGVETAHLAGRTRYMEKRQAAVEMAGAACHELAQPLTTLGFLVEKARRLWPAGEGSVRCLAEIEAELDKISQLMQRISQVDEYATKPYVGGANIIDLQAAANGLGVKGRANKE